MQTNKNLTTTTKKLSLLFENVTLYKGMVFQIYFYLFFRILALVYVKKSLKDIRMLNS